jgi:hypothetical protein
MASRELTPLELEKVEAKLKDLKSNKRSFVKRYGKDAEKVMRGRAISSVKKETEKMNKEQIRELIKSSLMGPVKEIDIEVGADRYEGEKDLSQASAMMDELESLLKGFDWYYYMSDDPRVYRTWGAVDSKISDLVRKLKDMGYGEDAKNLYNQYAPDGDISMKMKEAKGKDMDKDGDIDSDDYMAARDAAIKKAKGEMDEDYDPDQAQLDDEDEIPMSYDDEGKPLGLGEDLDIGHQDNEPHMLKGDLYRLGKYAMELYQMVDEFEGKGEVDFPAWWQAKITKAKDMIIAAKHYLDFEMKEPEIDSMLDAAEEADVFDNVGVDTEMFEGEVGKVDKLAAKIAKALKDKANQSAEDQNNIKQARKAMNDDKIDAAEKIIKPYLKEVDKDKEGLMYAIATNLKKYGRPQSKASDKPAKLTKGLEKGREKYVKKLKKHMTEEVADKLAKQLKSK